MSTQQALSRHSLEVTMTQRFSKVFILGTTVALMTGCGGGGDSGTSAAVSVVTSFPFQSSYQARIKAGSQDNYIISGTCSGTATQTNGATTSATFEGVPGFAASQTMTVQYSNCTPYSNAVSATSYFNAIYSLIGTSTPGVRYESLPIALSIPVSVKVGDTAVLGTITVYADSSKNSVTGQRILSFVIEPDTASTAIVNYISKEYNAGNQLLTTVQSRYRLTSDGTVTSIGFDIQYSTTSTNHLIYTKS